MGYTRVGVVGGGLMGIGIAVKFALGGCPVTLVEVDGDRVARTVGIASGILAELLDARLISRADCEATLRRLHTSTDISELGAASLVIEAIPENIEAKQQIFRQLESIVALDTIIASNTSSFPPDALCANMKRKDRFLIAHFWNPPHVIPLVEVVPGTFTYPAVVDRLVKLLSAIDAEPVALKAAIPGFIGNRLQFAVLREALHIVRTGAATPEIVDAVMKASLGRRYSAIGPFEGADLGGLDTFLSIARHLMPALAKDEAVLDLLYEHTSKGESGISSGKGFYVWDQNRIEDLKAVRHRQLAEQG